MLTPRPYQEKAIGSALTYFEGDANYNAFQILPTGSGKSVVIACITRALKGKTLIFQPSKEILEQNFKKFVVAGGRAGIYSASAGSKFVDTVTFCTIGSVIKKKHLFKDVTNILVDECHLVNSSDGMYNDFIRSLPKAKVLGLTATPYRLSSTFDGAQLQFLNRTSPKIFSKCLYYIQNSELFDAGHLAKLVYFNFNLIDRTMLKVNSSGSDFTDASLRAYYRTIDMPAKTREYANRILAKRKNLLVFCSLVEEAEKVAKGIPGAVVLTGDTETSKRERILLQFKKGIIKCVVNVGVLTTGFDFPELEAVLIARSTMSLALYYQIIGRAMRPHPDKEDAWIIDLGGNIPFFGKIETMIIRVNEKGLFSIWNNGRQLTDVPFSKN